MNTFHGILIDCDEGELQWVDKASLMGLNLWEGDRVFLKMLTHGSPFFSMKVSYNGDRLKRHSIIVY